ncbi:hypothetical protein F8388_006770 [Cannabis sativa]|uniref:Uncharacterized protein n=1 Tax=Cannabis sativa TaxID=3483 RepID=A0A7J6GV81_CANSA|nr:hypothetical protein F8388_006770 [Cannabis sativa]KAF4397888.1 hypothetical protein G4B88_019609 [Cannabis sativa]
MPDSFSDALDPAHHGVLHSAAPAELKGMITKAQPLRVLTIAWKELEKLKPPHLFSSKRKKKYSDRETLRVFKGLNFDPNMICISGEARAIEFLGRKLEGKFEGKLLNQLPIVLCRSQD